jgi:UDP-N-acetylmuramoyl-tripeptide--D-alanyl-D-alanine ligase
MLEFHPEQLQEWSGGRWNGPASRPVRGFSFDSRQIAAGDLFICLKTDSRDGHDFISQAAAAGAAGALVSEPRPEIALPQLVVDDPLTALGRMAAAHRRRFSGPVVGVTGSCGKTSTKDLLALLLGGSSSVHSTKGNFNNLIGVPITLLGIDPDRHRAAVIEAGINQGGEMEALAAMIQPSHALVTLIAAAHLELLGDLAGVAREKTHLLRAVPASGAVAFPAVCLGYESFHHLSASVSTIAVEDEAKGSRPAVVYRAEQFPGRTVLHLMSGGARQIFTLRKVSAGMASNAVLAIHMARLLGVSDPQIQERLLNWAPACFRGEVVEYGSARFYVDCYNSNPAAMEDALDFFQELSSGSVRRMYVLGCMAELGADSAAYHRRIGSRIKLQAGDRIYITGREDVEVLREGLLAAGNAASQIRIFKRIDEIEEDVNSFEGFVFIKGSRLYGLEALVERAARRASNHAQAPEGARNHPAGGRTSKGYEPVGRKVPC